MDPTHAALAGTLTMSRLNRGLPAIVATAGLKSIRERWVMHRPNKKKKHTKALMRTSCSTTRQQFPFRRCSIDRKWLKRGNDSLGTHTQKGKAHEVVGCGARIAQTVLQNRLNRFWLIGSWFNGAPEGQWRWVLRWLIPPQQDPGRVL